MPTESKRSRSYRTDDDGQSGTWKRRNDDCADTDEDCRLCQRHDCPFSPAYNGPRVEPPND